MSSQIKSFVWYRFRSFRTTWVSYVKQAHSFVFVFFFGYHAKATYSKISKMYSPIFAKFWRKYCTDTWSWVSKLHILDTSSIAIINTSESIRRTHLCCSIAVVVYYTYVICRQEIWSQQRQMSNSSRNATSGMCTACGRPGQGAVPLLGRDLSRATGVQVSIFCYRVSTIR